MSKDIIGAVTSELTSSIQEEDPLDLFKYENDPVGFAREIIKVKLTKQIKQFLMSFCNNRITLCLSANAIGKTHAIGIAAVWALLCKRETVQVYITSAPPEDNLRRLAMGEIIKIATTHPYLFENYDVRAASMQITAKFDNQRFLVGVTIPTTGQPHEREARFSGKHAPHLFFLVDEADGVPAEVFNGIESCMSGGNAHLGITLNARYPSGLTYEYQIKKIAFTIVVSAFTHPNVITGNDFVPGAVTRDSVVERILKWTRPAFETEYSDKVNCFEVPQFLVGHCAKKSNEDEYYPPLEPGIRFIEDPRFSYMVLAKYPSQMEDQLISLADIERCIENYKKRFLQIGEHKPPSNSYIVGQDVAELGGDLNVQCRRYDFWLAPIQEDDLWKGVDLTVTAQIIENKTIIHGKPTLLNVDANGAGAGLPSILKDHHNVVSNRVMFQQSPTKGTEENDQFDRIRDQLFWAIREWMSKPNSCLPDDPFLKEELLAFRYYKIKTSGKIKVSPTEQVKRQIKRSPDRASAFALTFAPNITQIGSAVNVYSYIEDKKDSENNVFDYIH